jgi:hypothetical protein
MAQYPIGVDGVHRAVQLLAVSILAASVTAACVDAHDSDSSPQASEVGTTVVPTSSSNSVLAAEPLPNPLADFVGGWFLGEEGQPAPSSIDKTHGVVVFEPFDGRLIISLRKGTCGVYASFAQANDGILVATEEVELGLEVCDASASVPAIESMIECLESGCRYTSVESGTFRLLDSEIVLYRLEAGEF